MKDWVGDKLREAMGTWLLLSGEPRGNAHNWSGGLLPQSPSPTSQIGWTNWGIYLKYFPNCFQTLIDESFRQVISLVDFLHEKAMFIFISNHKAVVSMFLNVCGRIQPLSCYSSFVTAIFWFLLKPVSCLT